MVFNNIKIYGDGFSLEEIKDYNSELNGFTSNPSLMKKLGVKDYLSYCKEMVRSTELPISLEILSDTHNEIIREAEILSGIGENVFVKIPIINSLNESNLKAIEYLSHYRSININITAVFTYKQVDEIIDLFRRLKSDSREDNHQGKMYREPNIIISIFAGRIADTGIDPEEIVKYSKMRALDLTNIEILWASTREVFNIVQAHRSLADIITLSKDIYEKCIEKSLIDLDSYSLDTVRMFKKDGDRCGYRI